MDSPNLKSLHTLYLHNAALHPTLAEVETSGTLGVLMETQSRVKAFTDAAKLPQKMDDGPIIGTLFEA